MGTPAKRTPQRSVTRKSDVSFAMTTKILITHL